MTTGTAQVSATSATTERARALVAERTPDALALGRALGDLVGDPSAFVAALKDGLGDLADPEYLEGQHRVAPGIGPVLGVRGPLQHAVSRGLRSATRKDRPSTLLDLAGAMVREPVLELHWLAFDLLDRTITAEPELTWQLVRAEGRRASDWITVDSLAHVVGRGILAEPYRWAELEQLVYSPSRWERRLAGSTIATIPFVDHTAGRTPAVARNGLAIVADLIGDNEPDVQKALSWALRAMTLVDAEATTAFLRREAATARATGDGARAWVVRDALEKLPPATAAELRAAVDGIRRRPGAPSTSRASSAAADFLNLGVAIPPAERTVIDRT
jgi:3-methyladenine DNA glycosylase AlkD